VERIADHFLNVAKSIRQLHVGEDWFLRYILYILFFNRHLCNYTSGDFVDSLFYVVVWKCGSW
jgi:hypothetical protein